MNEIKVQTNDRKKIKNDKHVKTFERKNLKLIRKET